MHKRRPGQAAIQVFLITPIVSPPTDILVNNYTFIMLRVSVTSRSGEM